MAPMSYGISLKGGLMYDERKKEILKLLAARGYMTVEELAQHLYISEPTIRRDLHNLAKEGVIKRIHGGASYIGRDSYEWPFDMRTRVNLPQKRKIAKAAADLIGDGDHIFLDAGSTCSFLAEVLDPSLRITIVNNCFPTIQKLSENTHFKLECPCGQYVPSHVGIFGEDAQMFIRKRHAHYYFASAAGIDAKAGVTVRAQVEMSIKRAMRENADSMVLLMDHSKMGEINYYQVFEVPEIDILITDSQLPEDLLEVCDKKGVEVIIV